MRARVSRPILPAFPVCYDYFGATWLSSYRRTSLFLMINMFMISLPRFRFEPGSRAPSAERRHHVPHVVAHSHSMGRGRA